MYRAKFTDNTMFDEYDESGKARMFREVLNKQDELEKLEVHLDNGDIFGIDLTKGLFSVCKDEHTMYFYGLPQDFQAQHVLENIRVIYFVRGRVDFTFSKLDNIPEQVEFYALGFQATNTDGKNVQRFLAIQPNGMWDIRDNA